MGPFFHPLPAFVYPLLVMYMIEEVKLQPKEMLHGTRNGWIWKQEPNFPCKSWCYTWLRKSTSTKVLLLLINLYDSLFEIQDWQVFNEHVILLKLYWYVVNWFEYLYFSSYSVLNKGHWVLVFNLYEKGVRWRFQ